MSEHIPIIPSPCVNICCLDENDICTGCARSGDEITHWGKYSNQEKERVWGKIRRRNKGEIVL